MIYVLSFFSYKQSYFPSLVQPSYCAETETGVYWNPGRGWNISCFWGVKYSRMYSWCLPPTHNDGAKLHQFNIRGRFRHCNPWSVATQLRGRSRVFFSALNRCSAWLNFFSQCFPLCRNLKREHSGGHGGCSQLLQFLWYSGWDRIASCCTSGQC